MVGSFRSYSQCLSEGNIMMPVGAPGTSLSGIKLVGHAIA